MKVIRRIIEIDEERCDGCGLCVPACAEGSLEIVDGKARVIADNLCDGLGACLGECPNDALRIVEREAEAFDEGAVEMHLSGRAEETPQPGQETPAAASGCPSAVIQQFDPKAAATPFRPSTEPNPESALSHWPVQIRLVPPTAPFLKSADLLVVADCVPLAFPSLHQDFMKDKTVLVGCPKFDDAPMYVDRFRQIFETAGIRSITSVMMEVPCCSGLSTILRKALEKSGRHIPLEEVTISTRGKIIKREKAA